MGSLLFLHSHQIDREIAIDSMGSANATNLKPTDRLHRKACAIVEVVIDFVANVIVVDGMVFRIHVYGVADGPS